MTDRPSARDVPVPSAMGLRPPLPHPERRQFARLQLAGELHGGLLPFPLPLRVLDVSGGGFAVETTIAFLPGRRYLFGFASTTQMHPPVAARNVRCMRVGHGDNEHYVSGFEFIVRDPIDRETIAAMVREVELLRVVTA
jgi:PilZ domain-containing protein